MEKPNHERSLYHRLLKKYRLFFTIGLASIIVPLSVLLYVLITADDAHQSRIQKLGVIAFLASVAIPPIIIWMAERTRQALIVEEKRRRVCPCCGYDLRASPWRCPECGQRNP